MALTYTLTDDAGGKFTVDGSQLKSVGALTAGTYSVTAKATDENGWSKSNTFNVPVAIGSTPVYFSVPTGASAIYSMQQISGYSGPCVQVIPSNGAGTPTDIGFKTNGTFDTDTMDGLTGPLRVSIWYDQTGNGLHATQTVNANRPILAKGGRIRGKQSISLLGTISFFNLPAGLVVDRQNGSVITVDAPVAIQGTSGTWSLGTGTANRLQHNHSESTSFMTLFQDGVTGSAANRPTNYRTQPNFGATVFGSTSVTHYVDAQSVSNANVMASGTTAGGYIGKSDITAGSVLSGGVFALAFYTGKQLSGAEVTSARTSANTVFDINTTTKQLVVLGDSLSFGLGSYEPASNPANPDKFLMNIFRQVEDALNQRIEVVNLGNSGRTVVTMYGSRTVVTGRYLSGYSKNILHLWGGTNDIGVAASGSIVGVGTTVWGTASSGLLGIIRAAKTAGYTVLVGTTIPRNWSGSGTDQSQRETERTTLNNLITSNAAAEGFTVIDYASIPGLGSSGSVSSTYYTSDGVHLNPDGYTVAAQLATPIIQAAL